MLQADLAEEMVPGWKISNLFVVSACTCQDTMGVSRDMFCGRGLGKVVRLFYCICTFCTQVKRLCACIDSCLQQGENGWNTTALEHDCCRTDSSRHFYLL